MWSQDPSSIKRSWTELEGEVSLAEYDPLSDLYDVEYDHDYDLPFWMTLAERENGPVI